MICFLGDGQFGNCFDYAQESLHLGWSVMEAPVKLLTLAICSDTARSSKRAQAAAHLELPILSYEDWEENAFDITELITARIEAIRNSTDPSAHRTAAEGRQIDRKSGG